MTSISEPSPPMVELFGIANEAMDLFESGDLGVAEGYSPEIIAQISIVVTAIETLREMTVDGDHGSQPIR